MISATGKNPASRQSGFSIVEVLIVIGLIALLGGLIVVNSDAMLRGLGEKPLPDLLRESVQEARYYAAYRKETTQLVFSAKEGAFIISTDSGQELERIETGHGPDAPRIDVRFYQILPAMGMEPTDSNRNRAEIEAIFFRPDRSSTPFEAEIKFELDTTTHRYDPFSAIEMVQR